ncbi:MAG: hypothetical protein K8I02_01905 [Candidatus Methylomirabilis sp.]|nr:hypothetical protein [Deltaproteobacteria bacterium]
MSGKTAAIRAAAAIAPAALAAASCTPEDVAKQCIIDAFGGGDPNGPLVAHALEIAYRESRYQASAFNPPPGGCEGYGCYGLFQLHGRYAPAWFSAVGLNFHTQWSDPCANAKAAKYLYTQAGWSPWGG